jgi:signal transduction histidine kinase
VTRPRRRARRAGRGWLGLAVLGDAGGEMDAVVREDAMWAVYQTDRQVRDLQARARLIAETGDAALHAGLVQTFDILYSRVDLLERGSFLLDLSADGRMASQARDLAARVRDLAPQIDALDPEAADYPAALDGLAQAVGPWIARSNELLLRANADTNTMRVAERALRRSVQDRLAWLMVVLIMACIGIFALLMVQVRRLERSSQRMALLQERSRRRAVRAQAASQAKGAFLATMSHEIRTPLTASSARPSCWRPSRCPKRWRSVCARSPPRPCCCAM